MSLFFGEFPPEDTLRPTVHGGSAGINAAQFFTCPECGACVVDMHDDETNRNLHDHWHADVLARYRKARQPCDIERFYDEATSTELERERALADDLAAILADLIDDQDYEVSPEGASAAGQVLARYRAQRDQR